MKNSEHIWKEYSLEVGQSGHWKIGPLQLWMTRFANEWNISSSTSQDPMDKTILVELPCELPLKEMGEVRRYALSSTNPKIKFRPRTSDRPMVIRPDIAFNLPANEEVTLYIATTLWIEIVYGNGETPLVVFPVFRPSDTWFGKDPTNGELCYAARTSAKLRYDELTVLPYRAVTKIVLKNHARDCLFLERVKVPIMNLSLYQTPEMKFVTEGLVFERENVNESVKMKTERPSAKEFGDLKKISPALKPLEKGLVSKALSTLLG